jgi:hypothetical protein
MRKLLTSVIVASALIATFGARAAITVSGPSQSDVRTISDLHQPVRIGVASQVLRRMP